MSRFSCWLAGFASVLLTSSSACAASEPIRVAVLETLSSPSAVVGKWWANHVQFAVDRLNANGGLLGGRKVEIVYFDTKGSPQEALVALKGATDQGLQFVFGTTGSHIAIALS